MKQARTLTVVHYLVLIALALATAFPFLWATAFGLSSDAAVAYLFPHGFIPHQSAEACEAGAWCVGAGTAGEGLSIGTSLDWFRRVFEEMPFATYLKNSAVMALMSIAGVLAVSTLAGYPLARMDFPGRNVIFIAIIATMMLPSEVGIVPNFIIVKNIGDCADALQALLYGGDWLVWGALLTVLTLAGVLLWRGSRLTFNTLITIALVQLALVVTIAIKTTALLWAAGDGFWTSVQPALAPLAMQLFGTTSSPATWSGWVGLDSQFAAVVPNFATAFGIFLMKQAFEEIPQDLIDAARVDGATEMQILWKVMVPVTAPACAALAIFTLVSAWNDYLWPSIVISSKEKLPVAVGVFNDLTGPFATSDNLLMAAIVLTILPVLAFFAFTQRYFISGMDGAVK
ncbi:carbohydrate ABC transporter permease [Chitinibacteraceae bacterium HSL-7]